MFGQGLSLVIKANDVKYCPSDSKRQSSYMPHFSLSPLHISNVCKDRSQKTHFFRGDLCLKKLKWVNYTLQSITLSNFAQSLRMQSGHFYKKKEGRLYQWLRKDCSSRIISFLALFYFIKSLTHHLADLKVVRPRLPT